MKKVFVIIVILIFLVSFSQATQPIKPSFNIGINLGGEYAFYNFRLGTDGSLTSKEIELPKGKKGSVVYHWQDFVDINQQFPKEIINKIASTLRGSHSFCEDERIFKRQFSNNEEQVFGDAYGKYRKVNTFFSPGKKYAIVKSRLGPYLLLNLKTLEFEKFCIGNGEDVAWNSDNIISIAFLDSGVLDVQRRKNVTNTILIYDIVSKKKQYLRYEGKEIEDIKFLEDADSLVVSLSEKTNYFNPLNFLFAMAGHPIEYRNFSVEVFNYKSNQTQKKVVRKNVGNGYSFIFKSDELR